MITTKIKGGKGNKTAEVSSRNQLVTGPLDFSKFYDNNTVSNNVAVNILVPQSNKSFVITDIVLTGDRSIAANGAITEVFEATGPTVATVTNSVLKVEIIKQGTLVLNGLNILVSQGFWVNVKSDDVIVYANIAGYYVDA